MLSLICLYFFPFLSFGQPKQEMHPYESFEHFDVKKYSTQYERTFDKNGVIIQKKQYHALTISIYGIMNYDAFMETGDSSYYFQALRQYTYFATDSQLVYSDNNQSVGLPYTFNFKDLKSPWFSGMTQGTAVSYLLRYYQLTKNEQALTLSKKLVHLMLKKEADGGTIGRTAEGGPWIEEYPKSKKGKSVLNGFINGWIGLYEYCQMFPADKEAGLMRDSCYNEMINNVHRFDTPTWTGYSRSSGSISNAYLRYQLEEFDHLYGLVGDVRLRQEMRIWARMAMGKPDKEQKFLKLPDYQFAMELTGNPVNDSCVFKDSQKFAAGLAVQAPASAKRQTLKYRFRDERYYCEMQIVNGDSVKNREIVFSANMNGTTVALKRSYSGNTIILESDVPFNALEARFPSKKYRQRCVATLKSYDYRACALPLFAFFNFKRIENVTKGKVCFFNFEGEHLTNATVFYRYSKVAGNLTKEKFTIQQTFLLNGGSFVAPETGTYEFFFSYDIMHPYSKIKSVKLVQI